MSDGAAPQGIPAHETLVAAPRRHPFCCVVFVLNEGERLHRQLDRMRAHAVGVDLIVADGGSTDGSVSLERLAPAGVRAVLIKRGPGRLSAQMRMAFAFALAEGYEGIIVMDGNNKDDPDALPRFVEALSSGYDHVQGSRFIPGGVAEHTPWSRLAAVRLIHAPAIRWAAGYPYTDTTNGFRGYSPRLLRDPRVQPFRDVFQGYELHYYLAIRAARLGFRVTEIPVTRCYPRRGPVPTKISPLAGNLRVLRTLAQACRHRFDPPTPPGGWEEHPA